MASRETGARAPRTDAQRVFSTSSGVIDDIGGVIDTGIDIFNRFRRRRTGSTFPGPEGGFAETCPEGFRFDTKKGTCIKEGFEGFIERTLPGGETGMLPTSGFGEAVIGSFNIPALVPRQTGTRIDRNGVVRATLGCPLGAILGKDNLCYQKGSIPLSFRKWRPAPKAPVTAADARAIRKANSSRERVKKLARSTGLFVANTKPRPSKARTPKEC